MTYSLQGKRVWVAGHRGMVGAAILRRLTQIDCTPLGATHAELDLRRQADVEGWVKANKPDVAIIAAAKVGGILANSTYPADFIYDNLMIAANAIRAAYDGGIGKVLFLGSSCIYPKLAPQPMQEAALLTGPLEPTNEWYAIAKIAGIKLCQAFRQQHGADFISAMPTNLYGPGDNFDLASSHVLPALMRKIHTAKETGTPNVEIWGSGKVHREFMHVDDLADACIFLLENYSGNSHVNLGTGQEVTIRDLAELIAETVGFHGTFCYDQSKPDGTPRKLLDVSFMSNLGWRAGTDLRTGVIRTYDWFLSNWREPNSQQEH